MMVSSTWNLGAHPEEKMLQVEFNQLLRKYSELFSCIFIIFHLQVEKMKFFFFYITIKSEASLVLEL